MLPVLQVRFLEPGTWRMVWHELLDAGEQPLALHTPVLRLSSEQGQQVAGGDAEPLVAAGTALRYGEDHPCTGRVVLFRVTPAPEGAAEGMNMPTGELVYSRCACNSVLALFELVLHS